MKFSTDVKSFLAALKASTAEKKAAIPILQYVRVEISDASTAILQGTDLDLFTASLLEIHSEDSGAAAVIPCHKAISVLNGESGQLEIEYHATVYGDPIKDDPTGKRAVISEARAILRINGCAYEFESRDAVDFPVAPESRLDSCKVVYVDAKAFQTILQRVTFAISSEQSRYTLNGAQLEMTGGILRLTGTDGHRLSTATTDQIQSTDQEMRALVSYKALDWLHSNLKDASNLSIQSDGETLHFALSTGRSLTARNMPGQFPNWRAVMPRDLRSSVTVDDSAAFSKTLQRVAKCADGSFRVVRLSANGRFIVTAQSADHGKASAEIPAALTGTDPEITVGFNAAYILEFLKAAGKTAVTLSLRDSQSAALWKTSDAGWDYVLMPMRI